MNNKISILCKEICRSVVAGYTLFRTEVHSVAQRILALGSSVISPFIVRSYSSKPIYFIRYSVIDKKNTFKHRSKTTI